MDKILVVDDDSGIRFFLKEALGSYCHIFLASGPIEAERVLEKEKDIKVVVTDVRMPNIDGVAFLENILEKYPYLVPIVITAYKDERLQINGLNNIAFSYLIKPFDPQRIRQEVKRALAKYDELDKEEAFLNLSSIVGNDCRVQSVKDIIQKVSSSPVTVLVEGESGTGKELVARAIHSLGPRAASPFMAISCSAIPDSLLESELFGYEKGAFTGADISKPGKFEAAGEGTIFLDEIGDMSLILQAKLLRVLEERKVERLGAIRSLEIKARIIAATNKNLKEEVDKGAFRRDLYYRLDVVSIRLPPLRQRRGDIPLLVEYFIGRFNRTLSKEIKHISVEAMEAFLNYNWPGNIRELENVIQRAAVLERGNTLSLSSLPDVLQNVKPSFRINNSINTSRPLGVVIKEVTEEVERKILSEYMNKFSGNKTEIAKALGLSRKGLYNKLQKYHLI